AGRERSDAVADEEGPVAVGELEVFGGKLAPEVARDGHGDPLVADLHLHPEARALLAGEAEVDAVHGPGGHAAGAQEGGQQTLHPLGRGMARARGLQHRLAAVLLATVASLDQVPADAQRVVFSLGEPRTGIVDELFADEGRGRLELAGGAEPLPLLAGRIVGRDRDLRNLEARRPQSNRRLVGDALSPLEGRVAEDGEAVAVALHLLDAKSAGLQLLYQHRLPLVGDGEGNL